MLHQALNNRPKAIVVTAGSEEELAPLLASMAGEIREADGGGLQIQLECLVNSAEGGLIAMLTSKGIRHIRTKAASNFSTLSRPAKLH